MHIICIFVFDMRRSILIIGILSVLAVMLQFRDTPAVESESIFEQYAEEFVLSCEDYDIEPASSEFGLPRPTNLTNIPRCQTYSKRGPVTGFSLIQTFTKSGRPLYLKPKEIIRLMPSLLPSGHRTGSEFLADLSIFII